jgi:hypothetical protein
MILWPRRKLRFRLQESPAAADALTLAEAWAGRAGCVYLGRENTALWTPNSAPMPVEQEAVCDFRFCPLEKSIYDKFCTTMQAQLLPARIAIFHGKNPQKIALALQWFDCILVPSKRLRNTPHDLYQKRVLAYDIPLYQRLRGDLARKEA